MTTWLIILLFILKRLHRLKQPIAGFFENNVVVYQNGVTHIDKISYTQQVARGVQQK